MSPEYQEFLAVSGALTKLVVLSIIIERGLAFIFEHDWFVRLTTVKESQLSDQEKSAVKSKIPGLKGIIALFTSVGICMYYEFDIMSALFANNVKDEIGIFLTGITVAGGSAGAIAIFQGFLNINKQSRDALLEARKAQADSERLIASAKAAEAKSKAEAAEATLTEAKVKVEAAKTIAIAQTAEAKANQQKAEAELAASKAKGNNSGQY